MSYQNELTPQQLRNFKRRCRFTACGEPVDVFAGPTNPARTEYETLFITVNRDNAGHVWLEATSYTYADPTDEIRPDYMRECRKVPEADARHIIVQELYQWARMPDGTIAGYTPAEIVAEAERLRDAAMQEYRAAMRKV